MDPCGGLVVCAGLVWVVDEFEAAVRGNDGGCCNHYDFRTLVFFILSAAESARLKGCNPEEWLLLRRLC